ncbi:MAG: hypothetical protein AB1566_00935 [Chloroflexota bacterium]
MNARAAVILGLKVIALTLVLLICFAVASAVTGPQGEARQTTPEQAGTALAALLVVCFLDTAILTYAILHSRWSGWRLVATVFFVFYGVMTIMSQIESAVFVTRLPPGVLPRLFLMGAFVAAPFSPLVVLLLGKWRQDIADGEQNRRLVMPANEWAWKLAAIAAAYVVLYFTFGYFIAWKNPAVQAYYSGTDPGNFLAHMSIVLRDTPWLLPFQVLRALMWTALALPVIRMMKGGWWEAGLAVGLLFAALMNAQLLLPNPYMPEAVRMAHLVETASSNFIFGWLVGWLLNRHHTSLGDLLRWSEEAV